MGSQSSASLALPLVAPRAPRGPVKALLRFVGTRPLGAAGAAIVLAMAATAVLAPLVAPYDPYEPHFADQFHPPGRQYPLGTDQLGRDILSRLIYGSRIALLVGFSASFLGATGGAIIGVVSAYFGRRVDLLLQRFVDILSSFPLLILAITVVTLLGRSTLNLVVAIAVPIVPLAARVVRSSALALKEFQFVEAARSIGASHPRIIFLHILPNTVAPYLIILTAQLGQAILTEASLSFLGVGTAEPEPSWGLMLSGSARLFAENAPWMAVFPGLAISLAVFAFNLFGDSLRDALDPRLRRG